MILILPCPSGLVSLTALWLPPCEDEREIRLKRRAGAAVLDVCWEVMRKQVERSVYSKTYWFCLGFLIKRGLRDASVCAGTRG